MTATCRVRASSLAAVRGLAAMLAIALLAAAAAQPSLVDLLPDGSVLVVSGDGSLDVAAVRETLAGLDLEPASRVLAVLAAELEGEDLASLHPRALALGALTDGCPTAAHLVEEDGGASMAGAFALALSMTQFDPFPGMLLALRPADPVRTAALLGALHACEPDATVLRQDDVDLLVLGEWTDMPLVLAMVDGIAVLATDPELARGLVRRARGASEPRFADGRVGSVVAPMAAQGLLLALDAKALADVLGGVGALMLPPDEEAVVGRLLGALRALGGVVLKLAHDERGLVFESLVLADGVDGDPAFARLLACEACPRALVPTLIPEGVASVGAGSVPVADLVEWLEHLVHDIAAAAGEPIGLRDTLATFLGLDIDVALLDWWGGSWYNAQLEVYATDLRAYLGGAGGLTVLPVLSEEAARAGLAAWRELLATLPELATSAAGPVGGSIMGEGGVVSVRTVRYRDLEYERWRVGPTTDLGLLIVDGHLVIASPASAVRAVIDVHHGGPSVLDDADFGPALAALPSDAIAYRIDDVARALRGLAAITDMVAAPVATALAFVIADASVEPWQVGADDRALTGMDVWPDYFGDDPLPPGAAPTGTLAAGASITVDITEDDLLANGEYGVVFDLVDLQPGDLVQIEMLDPTRSTLDTFLFLFDHEVGAVVAANDDAPGTDRSEIVFRVQPGARYVVVASSYFGHETGRVVLNTRLLEAADGAAAPDLDAAAAADTGETIGFGDVLAAFDLAAELFEGLAARSGLAVGVTRSVDGQLRSSYVLPLR